MATRCHTHAIELAASAERVFALLHTPSAIRGWWGAAPALVHPKEGGIWAAAWGDAEDDPEYLSIFRMRVFQPPRRIVFDQGDYYARSGPLPFEADFVTEFTVEPRGQGCTLRVKQDGIPIDPVADAFYAACETGWHNTFAGIKRFLGE